MTVEDCCLWDTALRSLVDIYQHFRGTWGSLSLWKVEMEAAGCSERMVTNYTASYAKGQYSLNDNL